MTQQPLPTNFEGDAAWLVQAVDPHASLARLVRMSELAYRQASFLDDRMLTAGVESQLCPLDDTLAAGNRVGRDDARWIFHIGHVGSTLVARLLGELPDVLSVREPRALRDLMIFPAGSQPAVARALSQLMSRTFSRRQVALVKATSFVSEVADLLVQTGSKALFMFAAPADYIAGILAGPNSVKELSALHTMRKQRMADRGIELVGFDTSPAHQAAFAWACEMTSLERAAAALPSSAVLWQDFDQMLNSMAQGLETCAAHLALPATSEELAAVERSPLRDRYSKAPEHGYTTALRRELIAEAGRNHRRDIDLALAALAEQAQSLPVLAQALRRAEGEN